MIFRHFLPSISWAAIILFLSLTPSNQMPELNIWAFLSFDKFAHMFFYALFSLQLIIAFKKQNSICLLKYSAVLIAFLLSFSYGALTEFLQYFMFEGRTADYWDILANTTGAFFGSVSFYVIYNQSLRQYKH